MLRYLTGIILVTLLFVTPAMGDVTLFMPGEGSVSSTGVKDITSAPGGGLVFATDTGLSEYNGEWTITHVNRTDLIHRDCIDVPMDDFILAVEYDSRGNLWLGYTGGLQIQNSTSIETICDQQLLKNLAVVDLQKRGDEMWIATGNAGIHCYRDGDWTWYKPYSEGAPACYKVTGMAVDYSTGDLVVSSDEGGAWILSEEGGCMGFVPLADDREFISSGMKQVRSSSFGGVFFFNDTAVTGYNDASGLYPILSVKDLNDQYAAENGLMVGRIYDIAQTDDGRYLIATDRGIFCWDDGQILVFLGSLEIGNNIASKVFVDNSGNWWFVNHKYVGYYLNNNSGKVIPFRVSESQVNNSSEVPVALSPTPGSSEPLDVLWNWLNSIF